MVRWGIACRAIALGQVSSEDQIADIATMTIVGTRFYFLRARVLGLQPVDNEHTFFLMRAASTEQAPEL